jgi:hypothetical protein
MCYRDLVKRPTIREAVKRPLIGCTTCGIVKGFGSQLPLDTLGQFIANDNTGYDAPFSLQIV